MATKITTVVTCDNHPEVEAETTMRFQMGSLSEREVDLCPKCVLGLSKLVDSGRTLKKVSAPRQIQSAPSRRPAAETEAIRAWARETGLAVSDRGRIPAHVEEQYRQRAETA